MISVNVTFIGSDIQTLIVSGHANYDKYGKDIVCAGLSAIVTGGINAIESEIKNMPNYFADYDTTVKLISLDELREKHSGMPHGGSVIRNGKTGADGENTHTVEFSLKLDSNPEFTASVLVAYARAIYRLEKEGSFGCKTVFDIAPAYLSEYSAEEIRAHML